MRKRWKAERMRSPAGVWKHCRGDHDRKARSVLVAVLRNIPFYFIKHGLSMQGYQSVGEICPQYDFCLNNAHPDHPCCYDPCGLSSKWNPSHNELQYALHLRKAMSEGIRGFQPHMIIDTGRNGVAGMRSNCANWCNIRGAGVGIAATTETAAPEVVDAYFWLKTPGESDGCTQTLPDGSSCPRFDEDCASVDSLGFLPNEPSAPEAGQWFNYQIKQLAANARLQDAKPADLPSSAETSSARNPFKDQVFYVNPSYKTSLSSSIQTSEGDIKETLEAMMDVPSAYWLDKRDKIFGSSTDSMEGILEDAASKPVPELVVFIVYDLPNRDCHAKASNGELCCSYKADGRCDYTDVSDSQCRAGLRQYKEEYIDKIAEVLRQFSGRVPVVLVIEPDSLPNLSTNQADPRCGNDATKSAYQRGVSYAVKALAAADPYAAIYLDAGHGGWLGWKDNMQDFVRTIRGLGVSDLIRGFASNVAGVDLSR